MTQVKDYLNRERNDGNKLYEVLAITETFMGSPLPLKQTLSTIFTQGSDVYVTVRVSIDSKRHVAPISTTPVSSKAATTAPANVGIIGKVG